MTASRTEGATHLELEFADGRYSFALRLPQILELQRSCDAGIFEIYSRVMRGRIAMNGATMGIPHEAMAHVKDVFDTIRLGLIGGGCGSVDGERVEIDAHRARQLVEAYVHPPAPLKAAWDLAASILYALIEGYSPAQKKSPGVTAKAKTGSTKRRSSRTAQPSASTPTG